MINGGRRMASRGNGLRLVIGLAKALDRSAKESARNKQRQQREIERQQLAMARVQEKTRRDLAREQSRQTRELERTKVEFAREQERQRVALEKDAIRQEKDAEKRRLLQAKAIERQKIQEARDRNQLAKMAFEAEQEEELSCFKERCDDRRALRLMYVRNILN